jgi:hypothetical protein
MELTNSHFNGGLNVTRPETEILDIQAASCQNVINNQLAGLDSRNGYVRYYSTALSSSLVESMFVYNAYATSTILFTMGSALKKDLVSSTSSLYSGIAKMRSVEFEGNIYLMDGSNFLEYNGATASTVSGYIPTYYADKNPDGTGGGQIDELNYLTSAFKETFSGNATGTTFYMSFGSLTTGDNVVLVDNATLTSGGATAGFNVNYASGYFTLTTAASSGIGNVEITTHKPVLSSTCITNCTFGTAYGVGIDTNIYLGGNSSFPARIFWCDIGDATYFPATSYADIGVTNDKVMGFLPHSNSLLIWKYRSVYAWNGTPPNNSVTEIYQGEGCISTDSLNLVNAYPTCMSQKGIVRLKTEGLGYKFDLISEDINGIAGVRNGIMTETLANRESCFGIVFNDDYYLWLNGTVWVLQTNLIRSEGGQIVYPWIPWKSFANTRSFAIKDNELYFGGLGNVYKFGLYNTDDGAAIDSFWLSKRFVPNKKMVNAFNYVNWDVQMVSGIATSTVNFTVYASGASSVKPVTFTPDAATSYMDYMIRQPVHYNTNSIQYMLRENSTSGGFSLNETNIEFMPVRRLI